MTPRKCYRCRCYVGVKGALTETVFNSAALVPIKDDDGNVIGTDYRFRERRRPVCGTCISELRGKPYTMA